MIQHFDNPPATNFLKVNYSFRVFHTGLEIRSVAYLLDIYSKYDIALANQTELRFLTYYAFEPLS